MPKWYWKRLLPIALLFTIGIVAALIDWRRHPLTPVVPGESINMRNVAGDLQGVLQLYAIEFLLACAALQPGRDWPKRTPIGLAALGFLGWDALRWLIGLHSPTVMLGHDILMFAVAAALAWYAVLYSFDRDVLTGTPRPPVT